MSAADERTRSFRPVGGGRRHPPCLGWPRVRRAFHDWALGRRVSGFAGVIGAGGRTGRALLAALAERERPGVALIHSPARASDALAAGAAETRLIELDALPESLSPALEGLDVVYFVPPVFHPHEQQLAATPFVLASSPRSSASFSARSSTPGRPACHTISAKRRRRPSAARLRSSGPCCVRLCTPKRCSFTCGRARRDRCALLAVGPVHGDRLGRRRRGGGGGGARDRPCLRELRPRRSAGAQDGRARARTRPRPRPAAGGQGGPRPGTFLSRPLHARSVRRRRRDVDSL
jgi:hypothetical protein